MTLVILDYLKIKNKLTNSAGFDLIPPFVYVSNFCVL